MNYGDLYEELMGFTPNGYSRQWRAIIACADDELKTEIIEVLDGASEKTMRVITVAICNGPDRSSIFGGGASINQKGRHYIRFLLAVTGFYIDSRGMDEGEEVPLKYLIMGLQRAYEYALKGACPDLDKGTLTIVKAVIVSHGANRDLGIDKHSDEIAYFQSNCAALEPYAQFIVISRDMTMKAMETLVSQKPPVALIDGML